MTSAQGSCQGDALLWPPATLPGQERDRGPQGLYRAALHADGEPEPEGGGHTEVDLGKKGGGTSGSSIIWGH